MKRAIYKIVGGAVLAGVIFFPLFSRIQKLQQRDQVLSQKLERISLENKRLSEENQLLKTDPVYIEEVAREQLKVARDNEIVFRVVTTDEE